jgi:TolB-like protein
MYLKIKKAAMIAVAAMCIAGAANAQEKMKIAVMDFNPGVGVNESMVNGLSDMLINSLFETRKFTIVERNQLYQAIKEQGFQQSSLSAGQIAKVGKILGVKSMLVGTVNFIATDRNTEQVTTGMITGEFNLDVRIIDVATGEIVSTAGVTKTASKTYRDLMPKLAEDLVTKIVGTDDGSAVCLLGYLYVFPEDLGELTWDEAQKVLRNVNAAKLYGYSDWRIPRIDEMKTILNHRSKLEGIKKTDVYYLAGEPIEENPGRYYGYIIYVSSLYTSRIKDYDSYACNVRPVRTSK